MRWSRFSWLGLGLLLMVVWVLPIALQAVDNPQSGDIQVSGRIPGPPPSIPAVITDPTNGQHFHTAQIQVSGTCEAGTIIKIFSNNIFVGSTPCLSDGTFTLQITLLEGANTLVAKTFDDLDQQGPDSQPVTVYYDVIVPEGAPPAGSAAAAAQLIIVTDGIYRGSFASEKLKLPLEILGGQAPYAVNIDWGDGSSDLLVRTSSGSFSVEHLYAQGGTYVIKITAKDAQGAEAYVQTTAIVNGEGLLRGETGKIEAPHNLLWQLIIAIFIIVLVYLAGVVTGYYLERRK